MSDIQSLIKMLHSDNPNKRYDACEELRVSLPPLPQEAIDALSSATNDSNPEVADAAQRALALHAPKSTLNVVTENNDVGKELGNTNAVTPFYGMKIGMFGAFVAVIPVSILKTIMSIELGWSCTTPYADFGSIMLSSCGLVNIPFDDFMCLLYLGFALLGGALFGALGAYIGRNFWWSFAAGILFDLFFVFYFLWPGI